MSSPSELRAVARREAGAAARGKADLDAEAAGVRVRVGAVLHVEDVDPEQPGASRYRSHADASTTTPRTSPRALTGPPGKARRTNR
jgi:hypothetical protein